jgi:CheY-like chemotaxis protein
MVSRLKLGPQFTLLLALVFLAGILLSGLTLWGTLQHEAEEDVNKGSIFRFEIQVELVTNRAIELPTQERSIVGLTTGKTPYRILVVDDKLENRQLLMELLIPIGFEVQTATNGQDAIAIVQSFSPHLIWMDIRMPGMDGYAVTRQIQVSESHPPVIIALTSSAFEEDRQIALAAGFDDFVPKPFRAETIFAKMAEYLGIRYVYAEEKPLSSPSLRPLTAADLTAMPTAWIAQLHQAAIELNTKKIRQLIAQIPPDRPDLTNTLNDLADRLCYEDIIAVTYSYTD